MPGVLDEDMFVHEADLWTKLAGPVFRCELLVDTQCSDMADDAWSLLVGFLGLTVSPVRLHCSCKLLIVTICFQQGWIGIVVLSTAALMVTLNRFADEALWAAVAKYDRLVGS